MASSDAEVRLPDDDRLEFGGLARGISRFPRNSETRPPLTLAIAGDWGTGKSSLMQLVCADLRRFGHRPLWFNAWHHQKQEHLFAALLGAVRAQALCAGHAAVVRSGRFGHAGPARRRRLAMAHGRDGRHARSAFDPCDDRAGSC